MSSVDEVYPQTKPRPSFDVDSDLSFLLPASYWGPFSIPLVGGKMDKVNLHTFYQFGVALSELDKLDTSRKPVIIIFTLLEKIGWVNKLFRDTKTISMPLTHKAVDKFAQTIWENDRVRAGAAALSADYDAGEEPFDESYIERIKKQKAEFETVFQHEAESLDVFSIRRDDAYSTTLLIEQGESLLPPDTRAAVTDYVRNEFHEAGKCLAFNVSTAAGFHLARGLESALRSYYDVLSGHAARPKTKSGNDVAMQGYIDQVRAWADPKVVSSLEQFTRLHRNPINHPEAVLTDDEAITLVGITVSCITGMVNDVKSKGHASLI